MTYHPFSPGFAPTVQPAILHQGLPCLLFKRAFKVSSGTVELYRSSYGTDLDNSELASPVHPRITHRRRNVHLMYPLFLKQMTCIFSHLLPTRRLLCSSFLVITCLLLGDYIIYCPKGSYIGVSRHVALNSLGAEELPLTELDIRYSRPQSSPKALQNMVFGLKNLER